MSSVLVGAANVGWFLCWEPCCWAVPAPSASALGWECYCSFNPTMGF